MDTDAGAPGTRWGRRPRRRRRRHGGGEPSGRPGAREARRGSEWRDWLQAIDAVLVAVEDTAWSARRVAELAQGRLRDGKEELRAAGGEITGARAEVARFGQTGWTLASIAAGYRFHGFRAAFVSERKADELLGELHEKSARRFHDVSARHGGAFLKVGQLLSARPDLLPTAWIRELEKLQDAAPPIDFAVVRTVVEADFGKSLGELFAAFDPEPIAAASIGQVHRATTFDGRTVAVKVQRPGIAARVKTDLRMLEAFVTSLSASLPETDYETIRVEIRRAVTGELDYVAEAESTRRVADFFVDHPDIVVPRPVEELCSAHVLTTTFVEGRKITVVLEELREKARAGDAAARARLSTILGTLLEAYLRQVLEAGIFQADPHPGNILVTDDDRVAVLDFGCAEALPEAMRLRYLDLVRSFVLGEREELARLFAEIGFSTRSGGPDTLHRFADALLGEIRAAALGAGVRWPTPEEAALRFGTLLRACEEDPVVALPREFIMIARVFATLGGQFARYEPDIDFTRHVMPVLGPALLARIFSGEA